MSDDLKELIFNTILCMMCFVVGAVFGNVAPVNPQPKKQPIIIHVVDNAGGMMAGQITDKEIIEGRYTVTAGAYGKFLVTKEQYESLKVGDEIPEYLKKRGNQMKKQELIEKINAIPWDEGLVVDTLKINRAGLLQLIEQLDEPQKVQVPEFVADWIFKAQLIDRRSIRSALETATIRLYAKRSDEVIDWLKSIENQDIFVSAWANDYEAEQEKRYLVKMKGIASNFRFLKYNFTSKNCYMGNDSEIQHARLYHTRKELEEAGFGEVFDSQLFEVEEVE